MTAYNGLHRKEDMLAKRFNSWLVFNDLKASNPFPLELLYFGEGEGCDEEMWHKVFEHRHHHGEWYEF